MIARAQAAAVGLSEGKTQGWEVAGQSSQASLRRSAGKASEKAVTELEAEGGPKAYVATDKTKHGAALSELLENSVAEA